ncbi:4398_t:CDS:10, partial [Ambispora leptoticha]
NEPPLVPYRIPIIGHAFSLQKDPRNFLKKSRKQYGHIFSIYLFGRVITIVDSEFAHEVYNSNDLSFEEALEDWIPFKTHFGVKQGFGGELAECIRKYLYSPKDLNIFSEILKQTFTTIIERQIGDCKNPKTINSSLDFITEAFARSLARVLFEEELCNDRDVLDAFLSYGSPKGDNFTALSLLNFIHPWFYHIVVKFINNPGKKNRDILMRKIKPYIAKKFENKFNNEEKDQVDFLQICMPNFDKNNVNESVGNKLMLLVFAALFTNSTICNAVLRDYATRPEYWQELQDEQLSIMQEYGNSLSYEIGGDHKVIGKKFTFSNGIEIPYGRSVSLDFSMIHGEESGFCPNADAFDGFRYVGENSPFTRVSREVLTFGLGRHACPGRNFAAHSIKIILSLLIRKYTITVTTKSGRKSPAQIIMGFASPVEETLIFQNL